MQGRDTKLASQYPVNQKLRIVQLLLPEKSSDFIDVET
jgi:hypothetical protein